ncbi:MAG: 4Fe-4S dicluster domain-containing protein [Deltaproteobacteria bacterium]|nr:4Fe-4S dicluster domain-containing protein [Deltaproteobacteria bacterium]
MRIDEKIALDAFRQDEEPHIKLDQARCRVCASRVCVRSCPANLYAPVEGSEEMKVECSGCLECGTCLTVCPHGAVDWSHPRGGCGVRYRCG